MSGSDGTDAARAALQPLMLAFGFDAVEREGGLRFRSRGVPREDATSLLILSFLADAIAEIEDDRLAEEIVSRLEAWLARRKV